MYYATKACTNGMKPPSRTTSRDDTSYGSCFKCGQEGHFSNGMNGFEFPHLILIITNYFINTACPNGGATYGANNSSKTSNSRTTSKRGRGRGGSSTRVTSASKRGKAKSRFAAVDD